MNVRRLEPKDAPLAAAVIRQFKSTDVSLDYLEQFLANASNYLVIAEVEGIPAGFLLAYALQRLDRDAAKLFIYEIEVAPAYRRQGIGTALITHVCEILKQGQLMSAFVFTNYSNQAAVEFYESTGGRIPHGDDLMFVYEG